MKAATLRAFLSVHSWMGLLAGMALFIAFYAGAITVFTHALSSWQTTPPATQAAPADPVAAAQTLLDTVIAAHPQVAESFLVLLPGEHGPLARVY
ncbi:PepSY domain-containing protein, partial [Pseudomonas viridiflava]|uniref:PepSY domain-containing protein n=2 Tax=Gammaproteobacteria TaxID=1236 RepID=UPI0019822924